MSSQTRKERTESATRTAVLRQAADSAVAYLDGLDSRPVAPTPESVAGLRTLCGPLPEEKTDPAEVVRLLGEVGGPATMAISGGRFFGFVIGGCLPAAMAASWLVSTWDQNAGFGSQLQLRRNWKRRRSTGCASCLGFRKEQPAGW